MRHFGRTNPWNWMFGMGHMYGCRRGFGYERDYDYGPGFHGYRHYYPPFGYYGEYDREAEREILEHRLRILQEEERYIREWIDRLDTLDKSEESGSESKDRQS